MRQLGKDGPDQAPGPGPGDPPPEWAYHVGEAARSMPAARAFGAKVMSLPERWRDAALADAQVRAADWMRDLPAEVSAAWIARENAIREGTSLRYRAASFPAGLLRPKTVSSLLAGRSPDGVTFDAPVVHTALLAYERQQVHHAVREAKSDADFVRDGLASFPGWAPAPETVVIWDSADGGALIYARPLPDGRWLKLVFRADWLAASDRAMRRAGMGANWLRTAGVVERYNLTQPRYVRLEGEL